MIRTIRVGPLFRNLLATSGVQAIVVMISLFSGPLQARGLGPEGRGELAVVLVIGQLAAFLADAGTLGFIVRERAHNRERGQLIGSTLPLVIGILGVWAVAAWPLATLFGQGQPSLTFLILVQLAMLPFAACTQLGTALALGEERWKITVTMRLMGAIIPLIGLTILFFTDRMTVQAACFCYFFATIVATFPALILCTRSRPIVFDMKTMREAWRFGRVSMLTVLVTFGNARLDLLIVSQLLSLRDAGLYAVASTLAIIPALLSNAAGQSLSRRLSRNHLGIETAHASRLLLVAITAICIGVACTAPFLVPWLFGAQFRESVPVVLILLIGTLFASPSNFLGFATSLSGQPQNAAFAQFVGVTAMVVGIFALVPVYGLIGAAMGSTLGFLASAAILVRNAHKTSGLPFYSYLVATPSDLRSIRSVIKLQ